MIEFLKSNYGQLIIIVSLSLNLVSAIAALTASKKDDAIVAKIKSFLARFISIK